MIHLHCGDAFDVTTGLPSLTDQSVDMVLTDPPFDARTHRAATETGAGRSRGRNITGALPFAPFNAEQIQRAAEQFGRLSRRWCLVFCSERQVELWALALERAGMRFVRLGAAVRTNPRPMMTGRCPAPGIDPIVVAHSSAPMTWNAGGHAAVWESPSARFDTGRKSVHPTQKPLHLMRSLVNDFSAPGELILDPFAGSGTTALACQELGRRFVGWEMNAGYHAVAMQRLGLATEQLSVTKVSP